MYIENTLEKKSEVFFPLFSVSFALLFTLFARPHEYSIPSTANSGWNFVDLLTPSLSPRYIKLVF